MKGSREGTLSSLVSPLGGECQKPGGCPCPTPFAQGGGAVTYCSALAWWDVVQHITYERLCDFYVGVMTLDLLIEFAHNLPGHFKDGETEKE